MEKDEYLKLYKPYFVERDPTKKHIQKIMEAYENGIMTISIPGLCESVIRTERYARLLENEFIKTLVYIIYCMNKLLLLILIINFTFAKETRDEARTCLKKATSASCKDLYGYCFDNLECTN